MTSHIDATASFRLRNSRQTIAHWLSLCTVARSGTGGSGEGATGTASVMGPAKGAQLRSLNVTWGLTSTYRTSEIRRPMSVNRADNIKVATTTSYSRRSTFS